MSSSDASQLSPEQIVAMLPAIARATEEAARRGGIDPTDMQTRFWDQALHSQ
jgi:hypothetical protein